MAQGFLAKKLETSYLTSSVFSAGFLSSNQQPLPEACKVMTSYGIDISNHLSVNILDLNLNDFDLVLTMEMEHLRQVALIQKELTINKIFTLKEFVLRAQRYGPKKPQQDLDKWLEQITLDRRKLDLLKSDPALEIADPYKQSFRAFEKTASELAQLTAHVFQLLFR